MKKRILSIFLVLIMLMQMVPSGVLAAETEQTGAELCTVTEGCTFEVGHEGDCSPVLDQTAAQNVIDLIDAIGTVTLDSEAVIGAADTAYNALTDPQKAMVTNVDTLEAAKTAYAALFVPAPVAATEITVTDNVIDITDKTVASLASYYGKVVSLIVNDATVISASEDGTTIDVMLDSSTSADAKVSFEFGTQLNKFTMDGTTGSVTLADGVGTVSTTLNAKYNGRLSRGTATYTINFTVETIQTEVPTRLVESDTKEVYTGTALDIDLKSYFSGASTYYLVEGEKLTELEGKTYSFTAFEGGVHTLVFAASNVVGACTEHVTVTVTATAIESGIWIGRETSNGSVNYVLFTDAEGDPIDGITVTLADTTIDVVLPQGFDPVGKVTATFNRTANSAGLPFLSSSNSASGSSSASSRKTDVYTTTLSGGSGTAKAYLYNSEPKATSNNYTTFTVNYKVINNIPTLTEGAASADAQTITAGESSYSVDLSQLFADVDGQTLTYQVSINDAGYTACDANYTFSTDVAGTYVLKFRATDGQDVSEDIYTVTLTVQNSSTVYAVPVTVADSVEGLTFHAASLTGDVLTYENGSVKIPQNVSSLWWETSDGMISSAAVSEQITALNLQLTTVSVKTADGKIDSAAKVTVTNPNGQTSTANGFTYLLASGSGYTYAVTPGSSAWNAVTLKDQMVTDELSAEVEVSLTLKNAKTINVPSGAEVHVYYQNGYSDGCGNDTEVEAVYSVTNADGTVTYYYSIGNSNYGGGYSYVAFYQDLISYVGYFNDVTDVVLSWEGETKTPGYRGAYDTSTTFGARGEDSVVTNVNSNGHLVLGNGSEFMLKAYRSWQIINNDTTNVIIEPEFNYSTSNNNISITPYSERNSGVSGTSSNNWAYLQANETGTTYLEIGYDAVHIVNGYASNNSGGASGQPSDFTWNACNPNRTALIVVQTDGNAASGVQFGIKSPSGVWDYEYDTVYFIESQGSLTMTPTATGGIGSVAVSHDKGSSYTTLTGENGTYTVPIAAGNNIIRIIDGNGKTAYQVVRGAKVSYTVTNVTEGKASTDAIEPGDTVRVAFSTMHVVCPKISGIYNPGYPLANKLNYMQNGTAVVQSVGYQYDFHNNVWIEVTAGDANIELTGGYLSYTQAFGSAIGALYDAAAVNGSGSGTYNRSILPDITIPVSGLVNTPATGVTLSSQSVTLDIGGMTTLTATVIPEDSTDTVNWSSSDENVATVDNNGVVTAVSVGSADITAAVGDVSAVCKITVTAEQTSAIEIETSLADPTNVFAATLGFSDIKIFGAEPVGEVTGKDPDWSVEIAGDSGDSLTVTLQAALGTAMEGNIAKWYFWVNGVLSDSPMGSYEGYSYTTAVTPEWNDGKAILTLGVGTAKKIRTQYTVTLTKSTEIAVTGITLDKTTAEVEEGETLQLQATVIPDNATDKTVTWKSSDETVATVDENGIVTGIKAGKVTITASAEEQTAECAVEVKAAVVAVTGITLDMTSVELKEGKKLALTATVSPDNATDKTVSWDSSDETVASVDENGVVTAIAEGTAVILAYIDEYTAECRISVVKDKDTDGKATVYFSVSHDAEFVKTDKDIVAALRQLDVPYFDLALYGLEEFKLTETDLGYGEPTMLHLYIYATEILQCGVSAEDAGKGYLKENDLIGTSLFKVEGSPGSVFMTSFWGLSENLNYYHNYMYPADESGWGITADRVALSDGDIVTIGHFTSMSFHADSTSIFNYIAAGEDTVTTSAAQDQTLTLNVYRAGANMGNGGSSSPVQAKRIIYYAKADSMTTGKVTSWAELGTTDANGRLEADLSALAPGQYILATPGQYGAEYKTEIVSSPGGILLNVLESEESKQVKKVIELIEKIGEIDKITLESENAIQAAENAYSALSDAQKLAVTNAEDLTKAKEKLAQLKTAKADQEAADAFAEMVNAIDLDAEDCETRIAEAKKVYANLTLNQQTLAKAAKTKLDQLEKKYAQQVASEADKAAAAAVEAKIAAIKNVRLNSEAKIKAAREAYNQLNSEQKLLVGNLDVLTAAEAKLVSAKIEDIGTVSLASEAKIKSAREAYEELSEEQKAMVENLAVLEEAEEMLELLKLAGTDITDIYKTTGDYLAGLSAPGVGTQNGDWRVLGLARADKSVSDSYYNAVVRYVMENIDENGRLSASKSTENSRLIVALTALGKDVTDVGGYDLLAGLNDMKYIGNQGVNGTIWALIAFDTYDYDMPAGDVTREKLVAAILEKQNSDGGWSLGGSASDPDMTGMALQALAPYYKTDAAVKSAVNEALAWLSGIQGKDGTFKGSEGTTSESVSQVITALTALGINPETDPRFVKNGVSAVDALSKFYVEGGGFKHGLTGDRNVMATEQGYYALVSYFRLLQGKTSLYDMSDVTVVVPVYKIIAGANSEWQKGGAALVIESDGEFAKFTGVKVDGAVIDSKHYTAKAGSTVVTFTTEYLNTLSEGNHTITLTFINGEASTTLTVLPSDEEAAKRVMELIDQIGTVKENSGEKIKAARTAYEKLTGKQKKLVENYSKLTAAEKQYEEIAAKLSVSFTLLGCYEHGSGETHTLAAGNLSTWIAKTTYKVEPGATVKDVLEKALAAAGMSYRNPTGNYVEAINGIGEFTNGRLSGWMYTLNGVHSGLGVAEQTVKDGDVIVFHYTDDYTKESGSAQYGDEQAAKFVEELIKKLDKKSKSFKEDVKAAKEAYDALTSKQKKLVTNYDKLIDALKSLADEKDVKAAEEIEKLINAIGTVTKESKQQIKAAREAYEKLTEKQKALVGNILLLDMAEERLEKLLATAAAEDIYKQTGDYLEKLGTPGVGSVGGEWMVIGLLRSGREVKNADAYYDAVLKFVEENIDESGRLHQAKSSENSRLILALTALGKDVTDVAGHNLLMGLNDMQYIQTQGINGPIWALIAFDSGNYPIPEGDVSRDALIMTILNAQLADGGWALSGTVSDPDMTGMALQALAPYYDENTDVKAAVDRALAALSDMQTAEGAFASIDGESAESIAQIVAALSALDIDADTDARFVKNGVSALDALCEFFVKGGGFRHVRDGVLDGMATEQAYYALTAYFRMLNGELDLFDMTDIIDMGGDAEQEEPEAENVPAVTVPETAPEKADFPWWILILAVIVIAAGSVLVILIPVMKKKK